MLTVAKIGLTIVVALFVTLVSASNWYSWQRFLSNHNYATADEQKETKKADQSAGTPANPSVRQEAEKDDELTEAQKRETAQKRQELKIQRDIARFNHQLVFATWVIGIIGFFTGIILFFTLLATRQAAGHIPRVERAYVFPKIINLDGRVQNQVTRLNISAENVGKTPGFVKLARVAFFEHRPTSRTPHYPDNAEAIFLDLKLSVGENSKPLFPYELTFGRTTPFFCAGYIDYQDIFRESHVSRFLVWIDPPQRYIEVVSSPAWNDWT